MLNLDVIYKKQGMKQSITLLVFFMLVAVSCKKSTVTHETSGKFADSNATLVADTIVYQVSITNPNGDPWIAECLKGLNRKAMIDSIFSMVYRGKMLAFNHETNERMTPKQVHDLESQAGYTRDKIGTIQFTEAWMLNTADQGMNKMVLSMVLAYNVYTTEGDLIGPKPLFRVEFGRR